MDLSNYFKSIIDQDQCSVVICSLEHEIIYMNPAAVERYGKRGGAGIVGQSIFACHNRVRRTTGSIRFTMRRKTGMCI